MPVGTYSLEDLKNITNVSAADFGLDNILPAVQEDLAQHNAVVGTMLSNLAEVSSDAQAAWGGSSDGEVQDVDEFGSSPSQKTGLPSNVGFPLTKYDYVVGWTRDFFYQATPAKIAEMVAAAQLADVRGLKKRIARAIFKPVSYTFVDRQATQITLTVKPFANADGDLIPNGPMGETFDGSTHNHFLARNGWDAAFLRNAIANLVEHGHGNGVAVYINRSNSSDIGALTGFVAVQPANIIVGANQTTAVGTLDISRTDERLIGYFDGYPVYTRSWVPSGYTFIGALGDGRKPLRMRQKAQASLQGFRLESSEKAHPLYVNIFERYVGFGVRTRTNGVVIYWGGGAYVEPVI